jgi:hypothetical protein
MKAMVIRIKINVQLNRSKTVLWANVPVSNVQYANRDNILRITLLSRLKRGNKINGYKCRYTTSSTSCY